MTGFLLLIVIVKAVLCHKFLAVVVEDVETLYQAGLSPSEVKRETKLRSEQLSLLCGLTWMLLYILPKKASKM